jgi:hypothetical protein
VDLALGFREEADMRAAMAQAAGAEARASTAPQAGVGATRTAPSSDSEPPSSAQALGLYRRLPLWMTYHVDPTTCRMDGAFESPAWQGADAWMARPGFATLIARHASTPRDWMYYWLREVGRVDCPSAAFHNIEWGHTASKHEWLQGYKFNVCPENSAGSGYVTEKVFDALRAGSVPVYWWHPSAAPGDASDAPPPETGVINSRRVIQLQGRNHEALLAAVGALMNDTAARTAFFQQPVLHPGAQGWLSARCDAAVEGLVAAARAAAAREIAAARQ